MAVYLSRMAATMVGTRVTVKHLAGFLQCHGGKLEESDKYNFFHRFLCFRIEKDQLYCVIFFSNNLMFLCRIS